MAGETASQSHHPRITDRLMTDMAESWGEVESPCVGTCKLDGTGVYCTGCLRTRSEIGVWSTASSAEKRAILAKLQARRNAEKGS